MVVGAVVLVEVELVEVELVVEPVAVVVVAPVVVLDVVVVAGIGPATQVVVAAAAVTELFAPRSNSIGRSSAPRVIVPTQNRATLPRR